MSKHHVHRPVKIDGQLITEGVIELDADTAAPMVESGHLVVTDEAVEPTVELEPVTKPAGKAKGK